MTGAMQGGLRHTPGPRPCVVCETPLAWHTPLTPAPRGGGAPELYALCPAYACRAVFDQAGAAAHVDFRRQLEWRAQAWRKAETQARLWRERVTSEARENAAVFARVAPPQEPGAPADLQLVVPSGHGPTSRLPARRRRAYALHLDTIIAAALTEPTQDPAAPAPSWTSDPWTALPPPPALDSTLPGRLCGACGGGCCVAGRERAYLTPATIRRVMEADPGLDPAAVRALYLERLAPRTVSGSCINHTRDGCALPFSLRSDVCNKFACAPLKALHEALKTDPPVRRVVVLRRRQSHRGQENVALDNDIVAGAVLTEAQAIRLRPPGPDGWTVDPEAYT